MSDVVIKVPPQTNSYIRAEIADGTFEGIEQRWCAQLPGRETRRHGRRGLALELGAGIGLVTRVLREKYACVISVEANASLGECWRENNSVASFGSAQLRNAIVGAESIRVSDEEWWKSTTSDRPITGESALHTVTGTEVRVSDLLEELRPDVVVMDIEGAEWEELIDCCMYGGGAALDGVSDMIIELHPGLWSEDHGREQLMAMLLGHFRLYRRAVADGWPPGTAHPLAIEHIWLKR